MTIYDVQPIGKEETAGRGESSPKGSILMVCFVKGVVILLFGFPGYEPWGSRRAIPTKCKSAKPEHALLSGWGGSTKHVLLQPGLITFERYNPSESRSFGAFRAQIPTAGIHTTHSVRAHYFFEPGLPPPCKLNESVPHIQRVYLRRV